MGGSYDVILVLHPFRNNLREFRIMVRPLAAVEREYLLSAEGLYNPKTDTSLIVLRFDEQSVKQLGAYTIHLFAGRSGLPIVVPDRLEPDERRRFFMEHLSASYNVYVQQYPSRDEEFCVVERTLMTLSGHIETLPPTEPPSDFDIERAMPLYNPTLEKPKRRKPRRTQPPWRRLDSAS